MDVYDKKELKHAIEQIRNRLRLKANEILLKEYLFGRNPGLLTYEKLEKPSSQISALERYLICAESYLAQPNPNYFYDIFRATRAIPFVRLLEKALALPDSIEGLKERLRKLRNEPYFDKFDSLLFELIIAYRYHQHPSITFLKFLKETHLQQPELEFKTKSGAGYVECKKQNRQRDISIKLRDRIKELLNPALFQFKEKNISIIGDIAFHIDPSEVDPNEISIAIHEAAKSSLPILTTKYTVAAKRAVPPTLQDYALYPSPGYFWKRYNYKNQSEWQGIVNALEGTFYHPGWLDRVDWEFAIKWKVTDATFNKKIQKLSYGRLWEGLNQLRTAGRNIFLHYWFERDLSLGHRQNELFDFFNQVSTKSQDTFAWIIFNETVIDVT
ncbi:MAG: hypothetical protein IT572_06440, partial [Deltaproteobacteria bacterium]|nr:hypothetical protein [Deltaproteobacteria bacterium]